VTDDPRAIRLDQFLAHGLDSTVAWRLEPEGTGTRLFLEQEGFDPDSPIQQFSRRLMGGGWPTTFRRLDEFLAGHG
jgi:uncharacterized protein YndB with AHSA1/START domain